LGKAFSIERAYAKREVFPFSALSAEKGNSRFLCELCASSEAGGEIEIISRNEKLDTNFQILAHIDG